MDKPLVSVSIITYNHQNYVAQAIDGVLMQKTTFDYEILIGEDDSEDNTRAIVKEYKERYPDRIKLFLNSRENVIYVNGRPTGRWNAVNNLKHARGQYIALCEGDDYWTDPNKLQKQVDFLENNADFAICTHAVETVFEGGVKEINPFVEPIEVASFEDIVTWGHFIPTLSIVFRKSALPVIPNWYYKLWVGDIPLVWLIAHYGKNYYMKEVMGIKRKNPGGVTQNPRYIQSPEFIAKNKLFFYKKLNKFFNYEHKKVLNLLIARFLLKQSKKELYRCNIMFFACSLIQSLYYSPATVLRKFLRRIM